MKTLGESVKSKRKLARLTQEDLAKLAGLSQSTISDIERGRNESSREVHAIAAALGVTVEELMGSGRATSQKRDAGLNFAPTKVRKIPVKSLAQIINREQGSAEVSAPDTLPDRTVAYALMNDSMEGPGRKYIPRDSTLYIVEGAEPVPGKVVLASLNGNEVIGEYSIVTGRPYLRPYNQQYPAVDVSEAQIAGTLAGVYWVP
jgi:transcriptional regulator with XRE-family HTH domain